MRERNRPSPPVSFKTGPWAALRRLFWVVLCRRSLVGVCCVLAVGRLRLPDASETRSIQVAVQEEEGASHPGLLLLKACERLPCIAAHTDPPPPLGD